MDNVEILELSHNPDLQQLVERLADSDHHMADEAEHQLLAEGAAGIQAVIAGMAHLNSRVRRSCADFMDHHGDDRCFLGLVERSLHDPVPKVRRRAVHALGCDRCKVSPLSADRIPVLMSVIRNDPNKWVRYEAIWALNTSKNDERYYPLLHEVLDAEIDRDLRRAAWGTLYRQDTRYRENDVARMRAGQRR